MGVISDFANAIQLKSRYLFGITIVGVILLFSPENWMESLGLLSLRNDFKGIVGIITLTSGVFGVVQLIPYLQDRKLRSDTVKSIEGAFSGLSIEECALIAEMIAKGQQTTYVSMTAYGGGHTYFAAAQTLCSKGILIQPSGAFDSRSVPFVMSQVAWKYICKNRNSILQDLNSKLSKSQG